MQNDNLKRIFCFFLCFILLISFIPRPAHAVGVDWILRQIATDIGVSAILEGLGIFRDAASDSFGEVIDDVSDALDTAGYVSSGMLNAYCQVDPLGTGSPLFAIPATLINFVRNWVFDNGVVVESVGASSGTVYSPSGIGYPYTDASAPVFYKQVWYHIDSVYFGTAVCLISSSTFKHNSKVNTYYNIRSSKNRYSMYPGTELDEFVDGFEYIGQFASNVEAFQYLSSVSPGAVVSVSPGYDLSLGVIAPSDTLFSAAYPQWLEHQRELEDGTTETVVQIGLGNTQAETESLTQEQIWSGQGTLTVPEVVPGTATLTDVISAIVALPGQIVTSITTALTNFFTISGEASSFGIQLKDFFPFCIPFDLFDFLTVLSAEPQAPVFKWEIPVPQLGRTFELEVDLSPWDPVASLFRTFELLAFIVGLALITREKFLRS